MVSSSPPTAYARCGDILQIQIIRNYLLLDFHCQPAYKVISDSFFPIAERTEHFCLDCPGLPMYPPGNPDLDLFLLKSDAARENFLGKTKFSNVFVKNLSSSTTEEDLAKIFGEYGRTTSIVVMRDLDGKSKCFGFVNFENPDDAATAVQELNGKKMEDKEWYVGRAQKKTEREQELETRFEQSITGTADKYQWVNLYLKNLDDSIGDEKLNVLFSVFGTITSCNFSRQCFSFVSFI
ncbi:Polyadenylate-binding protein 2 [Platanthera guangdongensis]|uniref:Polyadenylate-binding protein 2 n=1 Tax=Platanthera guangdongensis TaxID=2320717 RepID=A0ABR2MGS9_9ASPA